MCRAIPKFEAQDSQFIVSLFVPHNDSMPNSKARHRLRESPLGFPFRLTSSILYLFLFMPFFALPSAARNRPTPTQDPGYVEALAAADHFLQAWQSGDIGNGTALLTSHSKEKATTDVLENFFDGSRLSAYEVGRGKLIKRGRYEFPLSSSVRMRKAVRCDAASQALWSSIPATTTGQSTNCRRNTLLSCKLLTANCWIIPIEART